MAGGMRISLVGAEEIVGFMNAAPDRLSKHMRQAMTKSLDVVYRRVTSNLSGLVLRVKLGGRLRQSIQTIVDSDTVGRIGTNVEYARIHEYGGQTKAHTIVARGRALRFVNPGFVGPLRLTARGKLAKRQTAGSLVFRARVEHPGSTMPARPYMRPALSDSQKEIRDLFRAGLAAAIRTK